MENFKNGIQSLATLKKVDDYGMFQMTYLGDYGFDEFLKVGVTDTEDELTFMMKHLLKGIPVDNNSINGGAGKVPEGGCTTFVARNEKGEVVFGRNVDFAPSPSLQLFTKPNTGYASVSTANLIYCGYNIDPTKDKNAPPGSNGDTEHLPKGLNLESFATLYAPYLPKDGMNAKGVAIASVYIPQAEAPYDPSKIKMNQLTAIRLVLDKAASVDEAINLLGQYNIFFEMGIFTQYQIADSSGRSVIVNFVDGEVKITEVSEPYQICSNFSSYNPDIRGGACEFERYDKAKATLESNNGILTCAQSVDLLAEIGVYQQGFDCLQWSVLYNLTTLEGVIFANRKKDNLINFSLNS